ncbi:MAG: Peptidoglycan-N-acetylmuramic acid deacetylase PdaC [Smithella sp. PtaU1.Bin162]|nr:MAG: Peptidoglycan-N-acetylmuramic acid deacetylase PdaC [Smithella sp. PtaU1.Bin162]
MKNGEKIVYPAHIAGIIFLAAAALLFFIQPLAAGIIAFLYILLCFAASFFPATSFFGPVVSRGNTGENLVALTFDDGPSDPLTRQILDLLDKYKAPATFFVTGANAVKYPEIIKEIICRGHDIGNHSFHHDPFLMLKSSRVIFEEIITAREVLRKMGVETPAFRPPVGIVNPKLAPLLLELKMYCITFSCRAFDAGNRRVKGIGRKILKKIACDDIVLLHDAMPPRQGDETVLLREIEDLLCGLTSRGLKVTPLSRLIGRSVMNKGTKLKK